RCERHRILILDIEYVQVWTLETEMQELDVACGHRIEDVPLPLFALVPVRADILEYPRRHAQHDNDVRRELENLRQSRQIRHAMSSGLLHECCEWHGPTVPA